MKILLTGSSGMVGKNILSHEKCANNIWLTPSHSELDLTNSSKVFDYVKDNKPDFVIHAAGLVGGISANMKNQYSFLTKNLSMGMNLLDASINIGIPRLINLSSSCAYPIDAENPLKEESLLTGRLEPTNEGYSLAKISVQRMCEFISTQKKEFQYKTLIPCNLYGKWDNFNPESSHMIPGVINRIHIAKISKSPEIQIWGDGTARREFMFASDLSDLIHKAIEDFSKLPLSMNIGLGTDFSIVDYYEKIRDVVGYNLKFSFDLDKPVGMKKKQVSIDRQLNFGWKPKYSLENGLKETYQYYLKEFAK